MKKILFSLAGFLVACVVNAANMPAGLTGLWLFQSDATKLNATIGTGLTTSDPANSAFFTGPWTVIGNDANPDLYSGNGVVQDRSWDYLTVPDGISPNGGGSYVNNYTVMFDYVQTSGLTTWNSLFQTAGGAHDNDGDLFTDGAGHIGIGAVGYSTMTYDASTWHRIVLSVDNGSFFRVYVDGTLFLDGAGQAVDGRFSLNPTFYLLADDNWEDQWGLVGTLAVWDHALTSSEVAGMGGWLDGSATPTALTVPEPATASLLALGALSLALFKGSRKRI